MTRTVVVLWCAVISLMAGCARNRLDVPDGGGDSGSSGAEDAGSDAPNDSADLVDADRDAALDATTDPVRLCPGLTLFGDGGSPGYCFIQRVAPPACEIAIDGPERFPQGSILARLVHVQVSTPGGPVECLQNVDSAGSAQCPAGANGWQFGRDAAMPRDMSRIVLCGDACARANSGGLAMELVIGCVLSE